MSNVKDVKNAKNDEKAEVKEMTLKQCESLILDAISNDLLPEVMSFGIIALKRKADAVIVFRITFSFEKDTQDMTVTELTTRIPSLAPYQKKLIIVRIPRRENGSLQES
jgi:hypothetical protein